MRRVRVFFLGGSDDGGVADADAVVVAVVVAVVDAADAAADASDEANSLANDAPPTTTRRDATEEERRGTGGGGAKDRHGRAMAAIIATNTVVDGSNGDGGFMNFDDGENNTSSPFALIVVLFRLFRTTLNN